MSQEFQELESALRQARDTINQAMGAAARLRDRQSLGERQLVEVPGKGWYVFGPGDHAHKASNAEISSFRAAEEPLVRHGNHYVAVDMNNPSMTRFEPPISLTDPLELLRNSVPPSPGLGWSKRNQGGQ